MQFVWCYCKEEEKDNEISLSIRSVKKFFQGDVTAIVIGDYCPDADIQIHHKRVGFQQLRSNIDVIEKLRIIIDNEKVGSTFVWMMDDVHFINPVTLEELMTPRSNEDIPEKKPIRAGLKKSTRGFVTEVLGLEYYDYATHLPHVLKKVELKSVLEMVMSTSPFMLWETVYECIEQKDTPQSTIPFLTRIMFPQERQAFDNAKQVSKILNHNNAGFSPELKEWLKENIDDGKTQDDQRYDKKSDSE